jgi:hypothetical protein
MNLDEAQRKKVAEWIAQGLKISDIQTRIGSELGVQMTYMDVRLLVDDLKLMPKDSEPPKPAALPQQNKVEPPSAAPPLAGSTAPNKPGAFSVSVDQLARPGTMVSGKVVFSDGKPAEWYIDQTGRLGLVPQEQGYRPSATDLQQFQLALDGELSKMGF